jgi:esterase/lipase superfamily enzyme
VNRIARIWTILALVALAGCAGRPEGNLLPVAATVPGASRVDMLVATTREATDTPAGALFNGERDLGLRFADITVSIPPDSMRKVGDVQWPSSVPGDPSRDFVTLRADRLDLAGATKAFDARLAASRSRHVLIFVHGYNTRFEEAVYRFAQITHDSGADVVPVLFTWPSRGKLFDYGYDRESATYSRDALEAVLQAMAKDSRVAQISILAHSMGNFVAMEALRQMAIRNRGLPAKIKDIMLAAPDIDVDVFRREIAEIEQNDKAPPVTLFVSQDDHALALSSSIAGDAPRLGAINAFAEPYRSMLEKARVQVVDLTGVQSDDGLNHGKFAESGIVKTIGLRLAGGQTLTDARATLGERFGAFAQGAASTIGQGATLAASAPISIVDPDTRGTLEDQFRRIGASASGTLSGPTMH